MKSLSFMIYINKIVGVHAARTHKQRREREAASGKAAALARSPRSAAEIITWRLDNVKRSACRRKEDGKKCNKTLSA
jgi:hypothetical protein